MVADDPGIVMRIRAGRKRAFDIFPVCFGRAVTFASESPFTSESANRVVAQLLFLEAEIPTRHLPLPSIHRVGSVYDGVSGYVLTTMQAHQA